MENVGVASHLQAYPVEINKKLSKKDAKLCFLTHHLALLNTGNIEMLSSAW